MSNGFQPSCSSINPNTADIYTKIQQEISRLSEIGRQIPLADHFYSQIALVRDMLLFFLYIKYGNLLLSLPFNGLTYTIDDNDNVSESNSDKQNNQEVYIEIGKYFNPIDNSKPPPSQVGVSITYIHKIDQTKNHNSVVIIRKNRSGGYDAFHYETMGIIAAEVLRNLYISGPPVIESSLKDMFSDNISVYSNRSPALNQVIIQQIQNRQEGGMCTALSLIAIHFNFISEVQDQTLSPGGTHVDSINMECFNISPEVQLNCIRGFMKEASDEIIQRLYPLGNLASAFNITEISKLYQSTTVAYKSNKLIYLGEVLKYVITLLKKQWIKLPTKQQPIGLLTDDELTNYVANGLKVTPITGQIGNKYELTNPEQIRIFGLLNVKVPLPSVKLTAKTQKNKKVDTSPYPTDYKNTKDKKVKKTGGATKKKKRRKTKRRSKKRKTKGSKG